MWATEDSKTRDAKRQVRPHDGDCDFRLLRALYFVQIFTLAKTKSSVGQSPLPKIVHPRSKPRAGGSSVRDDGRLALGSGDCPAAAPVWRGPKTKTELLAQSEQKPQSPSCHSVRRLAFGVWTFVHMSPSCANSSTSPSASLNTKNLSTLYLSLLPILFDSQDRIYQAHSPSAE
jgi:ribosomal protein L37AE/L43A